MLCLLTPTTKHQTTAPVLTKAMSTVTVSLTKNTCSGKSNSISWKNLIEQRLCVHNTRRTPCDVVLFPRRQSRTYNLRWRRSRTLRGNWRHHARRQLWLEPAGRLWMLPLKSLWWNRWAVIAKVGLSRHDSYTAIHDVTDSWLINLKEARDNEVACDQVALRKY